MKGIIFDLDGTLLDSMGMWRHAGEIYLRSLGIEAEEGLAYEILKLTIRGAAEYIKERYSLPCTVQEAVDGINGTMERAYAQTIQPKAGAIELIAALHSRGVPMAIATATDRYLVELALKRLKVYPLIRGIVTCTEVGVGKRDGANVYEAALRLIGCKKEDVWVFEDLPHAARTASAAGFNVAGVRDTGGGSDQNELKEYCKVYFTELEPAEAVLCATGID